MFGKWAYGFWQCKNRYKSQEEILGVAKKYRDLHIPVDDIVQDWFWWNRKGEFVFNKKFPDPKGMIDQLHPKFSPDDFDLAIFRARIGELRLHRKKRMVRRQVQIPQASLSHQRHGRDYATNPEARKYYWDKVDKGLFSIGADAWWMDTNEPETEGREENIQLGHKLAIGSGDRYVNTYPLFETACSLRRTAPHIGPEARLHSFPLRLRWIAA